MPQKNVIKTYVKGGVYHIYNRGVEKRIIFKDAQDYKVFLKYLKQYLSKPPRRDHFKTSVTFKGSTFKGIPRQPKNYNKEVDLLAYCLIPNHFHLLIKQGKKRTIEEFMLSLATRYSMYFNKKNKRVGSLYQGTYKAARVKDDAYLLHLSRYIHLNPLEYTKDLTKAYSSYADYLRLRKTKWVKPDLILSFFNKSLLPEFTKTQSYKGFVEKGKRDSATILGNLTLEN